MATASTMPHKNDARLPDVCISVDLLYLSTSLLWWQAVADMRGVTSSTTLRMHARCTGRHSEGARNVYPIAIHHARSPLRSGGRVTADVHGCPRGVAPLWHPLASRDTPVAHTEENDPMASPYHRMRCPPASPLFASWPWLLNTGCSLEVRDITVH